MSQHTLGPWSLSEETINSDTNGELIARMPPILEHGLLRERRLANARLIAAAPDLLKILKRLLASCEYNDPETEAMRLAREIIAKAEGRDPVSLQEEIDRS